MKRTWLTYVAIAASLIAGFVCSTAFADNHGHSGGHSFSGGNMMGGGQPRMQFQQSAPQIKNLGINGGNLSAQPIKNIGISGQNLGLGNGIQTQIKSGHVNGNLGQVLGGTNGNSGIVGRTPQIKINPGTGIGLGNLGNGQPNTGIKIGVNNGINGINLHQGNLNGIKIGGNNGLGISSGNLNINKQCHIAPKYIDPCFNKGCSPHGNICSPCLKNWNPLCQPWWWTCHTCYYNQPIYYPVYTTPIVVAVPVVGVPVVAETLTQVPVGSSITLQAMGLGDAPGRLIVVMDKVSLESQVVEWKLDGVTATLPMFNLAAPIPAELVIVRADGQPATSMKVELVPNLNVQPAAGGAPQVGQVGQVSAVGQLGQVGQVGQVQQAQAVQPVQATQPAGELSAAAALVQ